VTRDFQLFCEGGGNSWGLDFDQDGRLFYSTNYGGFTLVHGMQSASYVKSFSKHGALQNPYAYGYFEHAPHENFQGGHVTVGGIVYQAETLPERYRGRFIAGDLLGHSVQWHQIQPMGSTVRTTHGGLMLQANDAWFATTDLTTGPDGAVYVADWHDARMAHPDPDASWDRSNGRIYRIAAKGEAGTDRAALQSFAEYPKATAEQLLEALNHSNQWHVRQARQELAWRTRNGSLRLEEGRAAAASSGEAGIAELQQQAEGQDSVRRSLEALWTLAAMGQFEESLAFRLLDSPYAPVRSWTVRLLGDRQQISEPMARRLDELAEQEPDVEVRQQIASSAQFFPAQYAVPMINANINRDIDGADPCLPLLWWWAVEKHSVSGREEVLRRFVRPTLWKSHLGREVLLTRLIRRYAAEGTIEGWNSVVTLLKSAPEASQRIRFWKEVLKGWQDQTQLTTLPVALGVVHQHPVQELLLNDWNGAQDDLVLTQLALGFHLDIVFDSSLTVALDNVQPSEMRAMLFRWAASASQLKHQQRAMEIVKSVQEPEVVRLAAMAMVAKMDRSQSTPQLIRIHQESTAESLRSAIRDLILGQAESARLWLRAVERGEIPAAVTSPEQIRRVAAFRDPSLDAVVVRYWGRLQAATAEEKLAEVRRLNNDLRAASGNPVVGRQLFLKHCAICHKLAGEGRKIGPDLTTANRQDREFLLLSLVDPSGAVRREYLSVTIQTKTGQVLNGLVVSRTDEVLTLADARGESTGVAISEIEEFRDSEVSLMPENLYRQFSPQQLRDLFAWLQTSEFR